MCRFLSKALGANVPLQYRIQKCLYSLLLPIWRMLLCMTYSDMTVEGSSFYLTMATVVIDDTNIWSVCILKRIHYLADNARPARVS